MTGFSTEPRGLSRLEKIEQALLSLFSASGFLTTSGADASGDLIFQTGTPPVERARIVADGTGTGFFGGPQTFLPASNGTDDTAALNAILANGGNIAGKKGESYKITAPLVIKSSTRLDMTGCTITLKAGSNCNMIHNNAWVVGSGTDTDIEICGGSWVRANGNASGSTLTLHSMILQRVTGLYIHDLSVTTSDSKFAINVYACSNFAVQRITFSTASDGVHMSGTCTNGIVSDIWGSTGDDSVALTTVDYAAYNNGDLGNASAIKIERVYTTNSDATGNTVKVLAGNISGAPTTVSDVTIRDIVGNSQQQVLGLMGDTADSQTQGGVIQNLVADLVTNNNSTGHAVLLYYQTLRGITLRRISSPNSAGYAVQVSSGVTVEDITIENCYFNPPAGKVAINMVAVSPFPVVTLLRIKNCRLKVQTKTAELIATNSASVTLTDLMIEDLYVDQAAHAIADFYTTTNLWLKGLHAASVNDVANLRAGAVINLMSATGITGAHSRFWANAGTITGSVISQGTGAPTIAGQVGDLYWRQDGGAATTLYRCTVAGNDGAATWTGIV